MTPSLLDSASTRFLSCFLYCNPDPREEYPALTIMCSPDSDRQFLPLLPFLHRQLGLVLFSDSGKWNLSFPLTSPLKTGFCGTVSKRHLWLLGHRLHFLRAGEKVRFDFRVGTKRDFSMGPIRNGRCVAIMLPRDWHSQALFLVGGRRPGFSDVQPDAGRGHFPFLLTPFHNQDFTMKRNRTKIEARKSAGHVGYPSGLPIEAMDTIQAVAKEKSWFLRRAEVALSCWQLTGAALSLVLGGPNRDRLVLSGNAGLVDQLYQTRESVHFLLRQCQGQTARPPLAGDVAVDGDVHRESRMMEEVLKATLPWLAWLRAAALKQAQNK
jgi:hypothetical protein